MPLLCVNEKGVTLAQGGERAVAFRMAPAIFPFDNLIEKNNRHAVDFYRVPVVLFAVNRMSERYGGGTRQESSFRDASC